MRGRIAVPIFSLVLVGSGLAASLTPTDTASLPAQTDVASPPQAEAADAPAPTAGAPAPTADAPAPTPPMLDEIEVVGDRPGPRLWKISKGTHVLWLLGTLDHVPKKMRWHSEEVDSAVGRSQELLPSGPALSAHFGPIMAFRLYAQWRGMQRDPDRTQLKDWLPAPLYARFEALKARYDARDSRIEELRPPFAALRLYQRAVAATGLTGSDQIERSVINLAQSRGIPIERARLKVEDPLDTLKQVRALSPALEVDCLATTIQRLETDLPSMQERARAWAVGDVERLRALPYPDQLEACISALSASARVKTLVEDASQAWLSAAESALDRHQVSFAIRPIYDLLASDGPVSRFRAEGYGVEGPESSTGSASPLHVPR